MLDVLVGRSRPLGLEPMGQTVLATVGEVDEGTDTLGADNLQLVVAILGIVLLLAGIAALLLLAGAILHIDIAAAAADRCCCWGG